MGSFLKDEEVDQLRPGKSIEQLSALIGLLCGQEINLKNLSEEAKQSVGDFLQKIKKLKPDRIRLRYEEFNELLLLFYQNRVERPFFVFFFLNQDPRDKNFVEKDEGSIKFSQLNEGVRKFRGFAMLCFGNFRFAFRRLSEEKNSTRFMSLLDPWNRDGKKEKNKFEKRQEPLIPLSNTKDEITGDKTWLTGYLSTDLIKTDRETLIKNIKLLEERNAIKWADIIKYTKAAAELTSLQENQEQAIKKGKRNTIKYLTWDFLDVYVATSMRQPWEFEETYKLINKVFKGKIIKVPKIRWFDPTQAYSDNVIDKGLIEGLMLKRAKCTIYMAQEGDSLGKDSELAATLAQGKPVIAYVRSIKASELTSYAGELKRRPIRYFTQRLLSLFADGFFDKPDNREKVSQLLKALNLKVGSKELITKARELLNHLFKDYEDKRLFLIIGDEEADFRREKQNTIKYAAKLLAAIESVAADNRAETIKSKHPLGMQVHLESGVANGVLVARSQNEVSRLVTEILTRDLKFVIKRVLDRKTKKESATGLYERRSESCFRIVTKDECLTNSFWNFYLENSESELEKGGGEENEAKG